MSPRPLVWKDATRPFDRRLGWHSDCGIRACSYGYTGPSLVDVADDMRHHVRTAHPSVGAP